MIINSLMCYTTNYLGRMTGGCGFGYQYIVCYVFITFVKMICKKKSIQYKCIRAWVLLDDTLAESVYKQKRGI